MRNKNTIKISLFVFLALGLFFFTKKTLADTCYGGYGCHYSSGAEGGPYDQCDGPQFYGCAGTCNPGAAGDPGTCDFACGPDNGDTCNPAYAQSAYYSQSAYYAQSAYYGQSAYYAQAAYAYSQSAYYGQSAYYAQAAYVITPTAPSNLSLNNSTTCTHIILNWADNSNNETGFNIYRGTSAGSLNWLAAVGANIVTYNDTPPLTGTTYYYAVTAYAAGESARSNIPSAQNLACIANFANSQTNKIISQVNGVNYSSSSSIQSGNVITFQLTLKNQGPSSGTINYICDTPSSNFINLRNVTVTGGGSASFSGSDCASGTEIKTASMTIAANSSRTITYDSTFQSTGAGNFELCSNTAIFNYTDTAASNQTVKFGPTLCNKTTTGAPGFQEVAP